MNAAFALQLRPKHLKVVEGVFLTIFKYIFLYIFFLFSPLQSGLRGLHIFPLQLFPYIGPAGLCLYSLCLQPPCFYQPGHTVVCVGKEGGGRGMFVNNGNPPYNPFNSLAAFKVYGTWGLALPPFIMGSFTFLRLHSKRCVAGVDGTHTPQESLFCALQLTHRPPGFIRF